MPIFLDANILFSGSNATSNLHRFVVWLSDRETLVSSQYALDEAARNIFAKRSQWQNTFNALIAKIRIVPDTQRHIAVNLPDKDKPILTAAIAAQCSYLLTGDKRDFGHLYGQTIDGVMVIDVLSLARIMLNKHG